mmetsp:Transcript_3483/g.5779  ORF Transcript_3483/g.5779 Transcript_3483/m.5779 type:complete len:296 (-) Transcript_3483:1616-2503(-)
MENNRKEALSITQEHFIFQLPVKMKLYFSLLLTASWLSAAGAAADDLNNDETSRRLMGDPLNNLRGGWPGPTPSMTTQVPTGFSGPGTTQVPTGFSGPGTPIPTEECGPSIEGYTKMGKGMCKGSNGFQHPLIRYDNVASAEDCPNLCNCALANGLTLRGFDYRNGQCRCRVESLAASPTCSDYEDPNPNGSGPVTSTDNDSNFCCFRNDLPPAPSVSPAPSTSFVPSVSSAPTRLWKNGKPCNSGAMCCSQCCLPPTTAPAGENVCTNSIKDSRCASYPTGGVNFCRTEAPSTA